MADLPDVSRFNNTDVTEAQFKSAFSALLDFLKELAASVSSSQGGLYSFTSKANFEANKASVPANSKVEINSDDDDAGQYTWDGITLTKSDYDPVNLSKKASEIYTNQKINNFEEDIFKENPNLFVKETAINGFYLGEDGTTLYSDSRFALSDFISVQPGKYYKRYGIGADESYYIYAYDANKLPVAVNGTKVYWQNEFEFSIVPPGIAYVRPLLVNNRIDDFKFVQVETYFTHTKNFDNEYLGEFIEKKYLLENSRNLFDKSTVGKGYFLTNGITFAPDFVFWTSDYISVEVGKKYKRVNGDVSFFIYAYDANKLPVAVNGTNVYWQNEFEDVPIPANVAYVRAILPSSTVNNFMFTESDVDTSNYISHFKLKSDFLPNSFSNSSNAVNVKKFGINYLGALDNQLFTTDYSHIIFYGQSLSMGWEAEEALTTDSVPRTWMIGDRVWINQWNNGEVLLSPLKATKSPLCGESPAVASVHDLRIFLDKAMPNNQVDLIATNCGEGGRSIERLSKESTNGENYYNTLFMMTINRAKTIANASAKTISCPVIVWMQGEYNYVNLAGEGLTSGSNATNDKDAYKAYLLALKNNMQADIMSTYNQSKKPLFLMYQVGGAYINLDTMPINMSMLEFAQENDDVILMNPTYGLPDYGGGHLSSNGYRWYGEHIAKAMFHALFEQRRDVVVKAEEVELSTDKSKIYVHCAVPNPPLVIDTYTTPTTTAYGFKVADDSGLVNIDSVNIIDGTTLELSLNRAVTTNAYVTYAGKDRDGTGNVRDSERWSSKYFYTDESSYTKKPTFTPKLQDGITPIYNKKYPMQNWLVAFYKKLN